MDRRDRLRAGSHLLTRGDPPSLANDQGYITSVAYSPMLEMWIGLALLKRGRERHGEIVKSSTACAAFHLYGESAIPCTTTRRNRKLHA